MAKFKHITSVSDGSVTGDTGTYAVLVSISVNTAGAGGVLTIYNGSSTSGAVVAIIDVGSTGSLWYDVDCSDGIYYDLATAVADVTICYE